MKENAYGIYICSEEGALILDVKSCSKPHFILLFLYPYVPPLARSFSYEIGQIC